MVQQSEVMSLQTLHGVLLLPFEIKVEANVFPAAPRPMQSGPGMGVSTLIVSESNSGSYSFCLEK